MILLLLELNIKTVGLKITPKMLFSFVEQLINKNKPINDAYAHVIEFLNSLSKEQIESLDNARLLVGARSGYYKSFQELLESIYLARATQLKLKKWRRGERPLSFNEITNYLKS